MFGSKLGMGSVITFSLQKIPVNLETKLKGQIFIQTYILIIELRKHNVIYP